MNTIIIKLDANRNIPHGLQNNSSHSWQQMNEYMSVIFETDGKLYEYRIAMMMIIIGQYHIHNQQHFFLVIQSARAYIIAF